MNVQEWSRRCKLFIVIASAILLCGTIGNVLADWDPDDPYKMHFPQEPNPQGWDICLHEQFVADDFQCTESGPIRDIHFWVSWQDDIDEFPLTQFTVQIRQNLLGGPCGGGRPGNVLWTWSSTGGIGKFTVRQPPYQGQQGWHCPSTGLTEYPDHMLYWQINITEIPDEQAFHQTAGEVYWLVIRANKAQWPPAVGWKTSLNRFMSCSLWSVNGMLWNPVTIDGTVDQAFVITNTGGQPDMFEFGDAPEGTLAYPATGAIGMFPTCMTVGPAAWIQHSNFGAWFGPAFELEPDGNAGLCPGFAPYDADECFNDGDAGLLIPTSNTIQAGIVVPCPGSMGPIPLGQTCQPAAWGTNIDVDVHNHMPSQATGYVNVLIDWNQDGQWAGSSSCPTGAVPEHVLVDWPVPNPYDGPVSGLMPPGFTIGPNSGYVWARISITEMPVGPNWDGSGAYEDGETEDYLLQVDPYQPPEELDWGDAPDPTYPTLAISMGANHIIRGPWLGDPSDTPDPELDGQPTPLADGDDLLDGNDDEDGLQIPLLQENVVGTIVVLVGGPGGVVEVWIDWNQDGTWAHPAEQVFAGPLPAGVNPILVIPPVGSAGQTFLRARISANGGLAPTGQAPDGEVEDHIVRITEAERLDFGDAPDSPQLPGYPTLLANNGARHIIGTCWLGDATDSPDSEADGQPTANADGDDLDANGDDEDGVQIPVLVQGSVANITFQVSSSDGLGGFVSGWIDFNVSSVWGDLPIEQVVSAYYGDGIYSLLVAVPVGMPIGQTYARFRISRDPAAQVPMGQAYDGEVEDYPVMIEEEVITDELKFQQLPLNGPAYFGHDELSTVYPVYDQGGTEPFVIEYRGCYMADDFADLAHSPVIRVRWWGSYFGNEIVQPVLSFLIAFESDVPAVGQPGEPGYVPSHPEVLLSQEEVQRDMDGMLVPGEFTEIYVGPGGPPCNEALYRYEAVLQNPFHQQQNVVFWLKITALVELPFDHTLWYDVSRWGSDICDYLLNGYGHLPQFYPVTRWGWHNRDYTKVDPYASTPPAVVPGERLVGVIPAPEGPLEIWHFQDDAVFGHVFMPVDPTQLPRKIIDIVQPDWMEQYYKYTLPYCTGPTQQGVDGPPEIEAFSKDLAFELWTYPETITTPAITKTTPAPAVADRVNAGRVETFVATAAVSSLGHALEYQFTWGDGTVGPWGPATQVHTYTYGGPGVIQLTDIPYNVTVQARCIAHPTVTSAVSVNYTVTSEAVISTAPFYGVWASPWNRPACWAYQRNCRGDVDGVSQLGRPVYTIDLSKFKEAYNKVDSALQLVVNGICADNNHAAQLGRRVYTADLTEFKLYYNKATSLVPVCDQTNYYYWTK